MGVNVNGDQIFVFHRVTPKSQVDGTVNSGQSRRHDQKGGSCGCCPQQGRAGSASCLEDGQYRQRCHPISGPLDAKRPDTPSAGELLRDTQNGSLENG